MKDLDFRRMCRLINALGNFWQGIRAKKMLEKMTFEAGMCMKTNNSSDTLPGNNSDIYVLYSDIFV